MLIDHKDLIRNPTSGWKDPPIWWGDERVHSSPRGALWRKDRNHYPFEWKKDFANWPDYFWPTHHDDYRTLK
jgi:hypothetical protein